MILDKTIIMFVGAILGAIFITMVYTHYFAHASYRPNEIDTVTHTRKDRRKLTLPLAPVDRPASYSAILETFISILTYHFFKQSKRSDTRKKKRKFLVGTVAVFILVFGYGAYNTFKDYKPPHPSKATRTDLENAGLDDNCIDMLIERDFFIHNPKK